MGIVQEKYEIIIQMLSKDNNQLNIKWLCNVAGVSRSGFYAYRNRKVNLSRKEIQDRVDFELILKAYTHRGYNKGSRSIKMNLEHNGIIMSRSKIQRLMNKYGLFCPIRKANPARRIAKAIKTNNYVDNLVKRNFKNSNPREILLTDITYLIYNNGKRAYLSTIKDAKTNEILAYYLSESLEMSIVEETIKILIECHRLTLTSKTIIHSDQGAHYTSIRFKELLKENNWLQSMSRRGNCWDNAPQESFYGHMKDEIDLTNCKNIEDIKLIIDDYMDYYNKERYQWNLAKLSPSEYYEYLITGIYPLKSENRNN